jgi:hypothetical protein
MTHKDIDEAESLMGSQIREYGEWVNVGTIKTTNILALLRELRERREADRWIPTSERMPDRSEDTLWFQPESINGSSRLAARVVVSRGSPVGFREATHWRPLPSPPESEAANGK